MARHPVRIGGDRQPALDLVSYGRRGPSRPERFAPEQVAQIARTVRRAPEVMVKVSGGGNSLGAVAAHFRYITRKGTLELETDDGERVIGREVASKLVEDWDLDIDLALDRWDRMVSGRRASTPKLVHNIVLSMPAGTSPQKLLAASRDFAREEFALQHRYALVLHTDPRVSDGSSTLRSACKAIGSTRVGHCARKVCKSSHLRWTNFARDYESPSRGASAMPRERADAKIHRPGSWNF